MTRQAALLAIKVMHDTIPEGSTRPLVVKFADDRKPEPRTEDPFHFLSAGEEAKLESFTSHSFSSPRSGKTTPPYDFESPMGYKQHSLAHATTPDEHQMKPTEGPPGKAFEAHL